VCSGLGDYFDIDPVIIRIIFVILFLSSGIGLLAYIIGIFVIPIKPEISSPQPNETPFNSTSTENSTPMPASTFNNSQAETIAENVPNTPTTTQTPADNKFTLIIGIVLLIFGSIILLNNLSITFFPIHWLRRMLWPHNLLPIILVVIGVMIIYNGRQKK
jgi:phage shock protein PspC (stress-responsive transcriptional regulator)